MISAFNICNKRHVRQHARQLWNARALFCDKRIEKEDEIKETGFAKAYDKFATLSETDGKEQPQTFATLLRHSKLIDMGDPHGKIVVGRIFHVVDDDLYIDFGWKFHCVCPRPKRGNTSGYTRGAKVKLAIKELELSSKFLGYEKDLTLLEADAVLLGLVDDSKSRSVVENTT